MKKVAKIRNEIYYYFSGVAIRELLEPRTFLVHTSLPIHKLNGDDCRLLDSFLTGVKTPSDIPSLFYLSSKIQVGLLTQTLDNIKNTPPLAPPWLLGLRPLVIRRKIDITKMTLRFK